MAIRHAGLCVEKRCGLLKKSVFWKPGQTRLGSRDRRSRSTAGQLLRLSHQPLEILNGGAQVGLNLNLGATAIACSRQTMILLRFGKQTFHLPHPLGSLGPEGGVSHPCLDFLEKILVEIAQNESLWGRA